ncbi:26S proteasome non-ATPase regulatory subunit 5 [Pelomyxa schiedti]|nr:26S proteasome non-ATPase regulatory subunit 5 [Pelomyxa schiedti]
MDLMQQIGPLLPQLNDPDEYVVQDTCRQFLTLAQRAGAPRVVESAELMSLLMGVLNPPNSSGGGGGGEQLAVQSEAQAMVVVLVLQVMLLVAEGGRAADLACGGLMPYAARALCCKHLGVSRAAASLLVQVAQHNAGDLGEGLRAQLVTYVCGPKVQLVMQYRVIGLAAEICAANPNALPLYSGFFAILPRCLVSSDMMESLNALEVIEQISKSDEGLAYVAANGILEPVFQLLTHENSLQLSAVRAFSNLFNERKEAVVNNPAVLMEKVINELYRLWHENEKLGTELLLAFGKIGTTGTGLGLLLSLTPPLLPQLFSQTTSTSVPIRICALNALGLILSANVHVTNPKASTTLRDEWLSLEPSSGAPATNAIGCYMQYAKNIAEDVVYATFHMLCGLAHHIWGARSLFGYAGFVEFTNDRSTTKTKQGKEWQFVLVKALSSTAAEAARQGATIADEPETSRLQRYIEQGPFYTPPTPTPQWEHND